MRPKTNLISIVIAILISTVTLTAQSTNPSSPTQVDGEYKGQGPSKETNYYFSITAGPGNVSVGLEIKAKDYSTFARMEIGNDPSNLIAMHNMNALTTTGLASAVKEFKLAKQQTVRIKLTLDGNLHEYKLTINGGAAGNSGSSGTGKTGGGSKIGKLNPGGASKLGALGSTGKNPKPSPLGSTGGGGEMSLMCPTEIEYQIVPIADWNATLHSKKRLLFDNATAEGGTVYCTYSANNGVTKDSSTLMKKMPAGYVCEVYNSGSKSRIITCAQSVTASLLLRQKKH